MLIENDDDFGTSWYFFEIVRVPGKGFSAEGRLCVDWVFFDITYEKAWRSLP